MSLIDEALKRAQAAHRDAAKEGTPTAWTPAPLPDRRRGFRGNVPYLLAGVFLIVLLAATTLFVIGRRETPREAADPVPVEPAMTPAASAGSPSDITSGVFVEPPPREAATEPRRTLPSREREAPPAPPAIVPPAALPTPGRPSPGLAESRTYVAEAPLPGGGKIELGGIVFSEANPTALINGRVVAPGGFVEGFEVVRILPDRVELAGNGVTISIALK